MAEKYSVKIRWLLLSDLSGQSNPLASFQACHNIQAPLNQLPPAQLVLQLASIGQDLSRLIDRSGGAPSAG